MRQPAPVPCTDLDAADTSLLRLSVPLMYLAFPVEYLLNAVVADPDHAAVFVESAQLDIGEIYAATALLSLVTMVPAALIASHKIWRVEMAPLNLALNEETQR